jgi:hypothetical protein
MSWNLIEISRRSPHQIKVTPVVPSIRERNDFPPPPQAAATSHQQEKLTRVEEENYYLSIKTLKQHNGCDDDDVASSARCFHIISELLEENRIFRVEFNKAY